MNIFILTHNLGSIKVFDDLEKTREYFKRHLDIDCRFEVEKTKTKPVDAWKLALTYEEKYDMVGYVFDRKGYGFVQATGCLLPPPSKLGYLYLPLLKIEDDLNYLWMVICHEIIHVLHRLVEAKLGIKTNDTMDIYDYNWDPEHPNGNFARNIKELKPHITKLFTTTMNLSQWKLTPELEKKANEFLTKAAAQGFKLKITQGYRDPEYQDKLYAQGRTLPGKIITNATGKTSKHCQGKAFDIAYQGKDPYPKNAPWKVIADIGVSCGLTAGYYFKTFKDMLHFEL